ncbi:hypothetical protein SPRG_03811 [Saprolegnia parasitica CBS 223.65]|uniref:Uncharacterized protein n=1 Tax=Saprolegnia parasitica (strain CBS 223.65) TaxID=695850 RepID=A0A067CL29_SAPPC|nr:hypothetical protein SPRG_03811 [Saprolegnia parasitica CBS 223.65]KDO31193.1 hypothetical protein SPRG_03811 [Saprolegnia parasitica CBS 223.65]|eukprot:XP_012197798.1 hypothetical protein SPRG_03811 [Saprolegnia parasitica CBS 223.65]
MYIGPWQEYKLAKIQDAAIQKLKQEWEEKLKSTLADEESIRQMMEPLLAKLPGMLLETRSKPARKPSASAKDLATPLLRAKRTSNQEPAKPPTSLPLPRKTPSKPTAKKPRPKPKPLSGIEAVVQRKHAYAQWKKHDDSEAPCATVLPPVLSPHVPAPIEGPRTATLLRETEVVHLPPIDASRPEVDDDDDTASVDEDELNSFLQWTDQLALGADADLDAFLRDE